MGASRLLNYSKVVGVQMWLFRVLWATFFLIPWFTLLINPMKIRDFLLERYFGKYEFQAPYLLSSSDCETMSIQELLDIDIKSTNHSHFNALRLGYTESEGNPQLRTEIAHLYQNQGPDNILCFAGAEEGIFVLLNCLLNPGDHIIVQYPAYQSLFEIANTIGCEVSKWMVKDQSSQWIFETEDLESMIRPSTKLIIINQPHNPTGALITLNQMQKIVALAQQYNLYLFSDEVYRGLEYDPKTRLPAACDIYKGAFSLGVMSKAYGLAGLRIGWIATQDGELLQKLKAFKDYTTICNSAPSEFLATVALQNQDHLLQRNLGIIATNLAVLDRFFEKFSHFFSWNKPTAGSIGFVTLRFDLDVEVFCLDVVEKCGVLLLPSTLYEYDTHHFRIGFGRKNLPEALHVFETYLEKQY